MIDEAVEKPVEKTTRKETAKQVKAKASDLLKVLGTRGLQLTEKQATRHVLDRALAGGKDLFHSWCPPSTVAADTLSSAGQPSSPARTAGTPG